MPARIIAEGILRLEHKLDAVLRHLQVKAKPMHFIGELCPVCSKPIEYCIDIGLNVAVRKCGCSSGKVPSGIPLLPLVSNGSSSSDYTADSSERQTRKKGE